MAALANAGSVFSHPIPSPSRSLPSSFSCFPSSLSPPPSLHPNFFSLFRRWSHSPGKSQTRFLKQGAHCRNRLKTVEAIGGCVWRKNGYGVGNSALHALHALPTQHDGQLPPEQNSNSDSNGYQSSWTSKNIEGEDYLYRLGKEADNLNITVGARDGVIDSLFTGKFLGAEADIVFKYRQAVTRSFEHIQGDYYIAPLFMDTVVTFLAKNYLANSIKVPVPLILGIWGGKGQGKSFQIELIFKAMGVEPIIMSAGELESEWAGEPGRLIRNRYRDASQVIKNKGKLSCLVINDIDAGIGRFANTQVTVNNQMVVGSLMNLCDNPTRVSIGQDWRDADVVNRVPIIVTGNDFSTMWAPLIRDGRMDKFYWQPTREDIIKIVHQMYIKDGLTVEDIALIVDTFPNQPLDFYGALRSRTYDSLVRNWVEEIGGSDKMGKILVKRQKDGTQSFVTLEPPKQSVEQLIEFGHEIVNEQKLVNEMRLSDEYMKKQTGPGGGISLN